MMMMQEEIEALHKNNTWDLVPLPQERKPFGNKWIFKIKRNGDDQVERLNKSLYGLKQASMCWYKRFDFFIMCLGYNRLNAYPCAYFKRSGDNNFVILLLYVDDILVAGPNKDYIEELKAQLAREFEMKDLGSANKIIGMQIHRDKSNRKIWLSQKNYVKKILSRFNMQDCKPIPTPLPINFKLSSSMSPSSEKERMEMSRVLYASTVESLMFAMICTRPYIAQAVGVVSWYMANPDSDYAGDLDKSKSTIRYVYKVAGEVVSWVSKLQSVVATSTTEAEYVAATQVNKEAIWLKMLLEELGHNQEYVSMFCDSQNALHLAKNPIFHSRTKHIRVQYHFIREKVEKGTINMQKIHTKDNIADFMTKTINTDKFTWCRSSCGMSETGNANAVVPSPSASKFSGKTHWKVGSMINKVRRMNTVFSVLDVSLEKSQKQIPDSPSFSNSPASFRRSRSLSSAAFLVDGLGLEDFPSSYDQNRSPDITPNHQYDQSSRPPLFSWFIPGELVLQGCGVVHQEALPLALAMCQVKLWTDISVENSCRKAIVSKRNKFYSFREAKGTRLQFSSRDRVENGFGRESPQMIAKNVIERLSQTHVPRSSSKEFDLHIPITTEDEDTDVELQRRSKEAEERVLILSEALEQDSFLRNIGRIAERGRAKEEMRMTREELESRTKKLETEKHEIQLGLEKELDRRSSNWSSKLKKYRSEEQRLRERVRELAEQNVSLQREVSSLNEKEFENRSMMTYSAEQLKEFTRRVETLNDENEDLRQTLSQLQEKHQAAIEDTDCIRRNFEEKDKECKELQKSTARLFRTCSEQEKTIEGLREGYGQERSMGKNENRVKFFQMEQMRLTGVELSLRREVESCRHEVDSLRHENIDLLNRLKGNRKDVGALTFKLDKEMKNRVSCLQDQGLSMLNESIHLSSKLIEFIKGKASQLQETQQGLDGQFIVESDMKVQCFRRGIESLTRSLQIISTLLHEKSTTVASEVHSEYMKSDNQSSEEVLRTELKSESLLTNLLREELYSKELEVEWLQAEVGASVRGNDILRCEVQNAMDNISCLTRSVQMLKKDDNISRLQNDLQESVKELTILRGILPKVSEERDLMWEEVKQYGEKNMLLNSEVVVLKKKIEALDEDVLLKEGQITILKDALSNNKTFNLLGSPDLSLEFLLE
ncbi:macrophage erythroblast attacher-like isoform X1 [Hibiscus syriacus]|uniref:Macrophage erythroblast attacher-like isoform X1 n=1 Tax=Hibiscus syriacus TaxID=106335 RepID=A0A6A2YDV9_HIBSY|nr:macrophage erythroblast attacher-like isoform X1 [Hibiscus syriacus]